MSANLRRSLHDALEQFSFRFNMGRYLNSFDQLVEEEWATFRELQGFTSGHNLNLMFADRTEDNAAILAALPDDAFSPNGFREQLAHFMSVTRKSGYYAVPARHQPDHAATTYVCFQILGFRPGHRKYMQRLTQWSTDEWKGSLSCAVLGTFDVSKGAEPENERQGDPGATTFKTCSSMVQPVPLDDIFVNDNIDYLHEFKDVVHQTEFDEAAVHEMVGDPISDDPLDESLAKLREILTTYGGFLNVVVPQNHGFQFNTSIAKLKMIWEFGVPLL